MSLDGLNSSNSPSEIDHPKYTTLATDTITLNNTFQKYFKESFFANVIYECFSSVSSQTRKTTFTVCSHLKEPTSFLKILLQRVTYDITDGQAINNEYKIDILSEFLIKIP